MSLSNTSVRVIVALVGIPILLGSAAAGGVIFFIVVVVLTLGAVWELARIFSSGKGILPIRTVGIAGALALLLDAWMWGGDHWGWLLLAGVVAILLIEVFRTGEGDPASVVGGTLTSWIYVAVPLSHLLWLRGSPGITGTPPEAGAWLVVALWVMVWVADTTAFFVGRSLGQRKLMVRVSPGKTWEGTVAGVLGGGIAGGVLAAAVEELAWSVPLGIGLGLMTAVAAVLGDLAESRLKRGAGLKDMGDVLPGHGGFLDRFDSTLFCAPLLYYVLLIR